MLEGVLLCRVASYPGLIEALFLIGENVHGGGGGGGGGGGRETIHIIRWVV